MEEVEINMLRYEHNRGSFSGGGGGQILAGLSRGLESRVGGAGIQADLGANNRMRDRWWDPTSR